MTDDAEMSDTALLARLSADGPLLRDAARRAGWDTSVPGLDWTVRELFVHTGAVHRWSADIVARALLTNETGGSAAFHPDGLSDGELVEWFDEGHRILVQTLYRADPELQTYTFARGVPGRHFWIRRQAHETAVHRLDVEAAAGALTSLPASFAQDGIDELAAGFARSRAFALNTPGTLALAATDGASWLIDFSGERIETIRTGEVRPADATVHGGSVQLYLWLWNRPAHVAVVGDAQVAELWRRVRIT